MAAVLIDTNVLVYAHDRTEYTKQKRAIHVLDRLNVTGSGRLSVQCLAEFFCATTHGPDPKLTLVEAMQQLERLTRAWPVIELTPMIVQEASRGVRDHHLAYWDAQIWATARLNQIPVIFSEDFTDGMILEGVRFINPFVAGFAIETWS